ncbi:unnamed protein product [Amoebophrya sp. A120]|nr:unnamed protein product [Amoebophrya sp. A120]|eukprot:GSA120T00010576001.1
MESTRRTEGRHDALSSSPTGGTDRSSETAVLTGTSRSSSSRNLHWREEQRDHNVGERSRRSFQPASCHQVVPQHCATDCSKEEDLFYDAHEDFSNATTPPASSRTRGINRSSEERSRSSNNSHDHGTSGSYTPAEVAQIELATCAILESTEERPLPCFCKTSSKPRRPRRADGKTSNSCHFSSRSGGKATRSPAKKSEAGQKTNRTTRFSRFFLGACSLAGSAYALSNQCRVEFDKMYLEDVQHFISWKHFWTFCGVRQQNRLATCCDTIDFATKQSSGCTDACKTTCLFSEYENFCEGAAPASTPRIACTATRLPYKSDIGEFQSEETFCIPESCNTDADLAGIMEHYSTSVQEDIDPLYSTGEYTDAVITCPSNTLQTVLIVLGVIFGVASLAGLLYYLCRVPAQALDTGVSSRTIAPENVVYHGRRGAKQGDWDVMQFYYV